MYTWIFYSTIGMLQCGLLMALLKVPAAKGINKYILSFWTFLFSLIIASIILFSHISINYEIIIYSVIWGLSFNILTLLQMHALHSHDTSVVLPLTSLASNILVVLGGILIYHERLSLIQSIAVILGIILMIASQIKSTKAFILSVIPLFGLIALTSTFNKFIQKEGSTIGDVANFTFWQCLFVFISTIFILIYKERSLKLSEFYNGSILSWALITGVLQFSVTYTFVLALSTGPISLVYMIIGLYTFFTAIFAALLFKEKITWGRITFILLSFLIILLIKIG